MIYAFIILGIIGLSFLLLFLNKKQLAKTTKVFALVFFAVFLTRWLSTDAITSVVGATSEHGLMSPAMLVLISILRWATVAGVLIVGISAFFEIKTLKNLASFYLPIVVVLNICLFGYNMIAIQGVNFSFSHWRAIQFAVEIAMMGAYGAWHLYKKISSKDFENFGEQLKYMFIVLPLFFVACMPLDFIQNVFGLIGGETEDFSLTHRMTFYITFITPALLFVGFRKKTYTIQRAALLTMSLGCVLTYTYTFDFMHITFTNLPLHLCNTAVFLLFIAFTFKVKSVFYFNYIINVIGAIIAIALPDTTGAISSVSNMHFWYNHIYIAFMPILARLFGHFERPTLKLMKGALIIFTIYFVCMMFVNAWFNGIPGISVDYFFLYKDKISSKITFLDKIRLDNVWTITVNGVGYKVFWLYDILVYVGYIFMVFMIWYLYVIVYKVEDHYAELFALKKADMLEIAKFKKQLGGRPITSPINPKGTNMIKISHFSKVYGHNKHKSVDDFSLEVYEGEVFGFLGHNGAGKSTLIKSMVGIQSITEGSIEICGYDIAKQPLQAKMNIGYVSDNHAVYENLTGREYVNYVADLYMVGKQERDERLEKYANLFNLAHAIDNQIKTYSHGMKQKLVVIAALIHNPKVWILDEPLTGLDPSSAYQIKESMREHANNGNIVFFSSHVIEVVEKICDRIAIIKQGKLQGVYEIKKLKQQGIELEQLYLEHIENTPPKQKKSKKKVKKS